MTGSERQSIFIFTPAVSSGALIQPFTPLHVPLIRPLKLPLALPLREANYVTVILHHRAGEEEDRKS